MKIFGLLAVFLLISSSINLTCARVPKEGDSVFIRSSTPFLFVGNITDITDEMICLNASTFGPELEDFSAPVDTCIGMGSITQLNWVNTTMVTLFQGVGRQETLERALSGIGVL